MDTPKNQNGHKRTYPKVKTVANERALTLKRTLMPCMVLLAHPFYVDKVP